MSRIGGATGRPCLSAGGVRGSAEWRPQAKTRLLLKQVQMVLAVYQFAITLRQVFYRLVGLGHLPKTENAYGQLGEHLERARRSGLIEWAVIADGSLTVLGAQIHDGAVGYVDYTIDSARHQLFADWSRDQKRYPLLWVESAGMATSLRQALAGRGWPVPVCTTSGTTAWGRSTTWRSRPSTDTGGRALSRIWAT